MRRLRVEKCLKYLHPSVGCSLRDVYCETTPALTGNNKQGQTRNFMDLSALPDNTITIGERSAVPGLLVILHGSLLMPKITALLASGNLTRLSSPNASPLPRRLIKPVIPLGRHLVCAQKLQILKGLEKNFSQTSYFQLSRSTLL